jgi:peptidoglycan/LPS O-acetylase OafA/YrhL
LFWFLADYGRTAVLVFFVLSGFVISWVAETRERDLVDFALSRIARLYCVVVPVFVMTAALDQLGVNINPRLYGSEWGHGTDHPVLDYALSAVFLGESWTLSALPGFNVPFWSLNYEAWYYVLFAAATFLSGRLRIVILVAAGLVAGPKILLLFPIWLMGAAAWRWRSAAPNGSGRSLVVLSLVAFVGLEMVGGQKLFQYPETPWLPVNYSGYDYIVGSLVALLIVGLGNSRLPMPGIGFERAVRWLAGTTFGLYLLHYPLLNFFGTITPGPPDGAMHRALVFGLTLSVAIALARLVEQRKRTLKQGLRAGLDAVLGRRAPPALGRRGIS